MTEMLERRVLVRLVPRAYWADDADCRRRDVALFFGDGEHPLMGHNADPGRAVCSRCAVRRDCLLEALLTNEANGMRGGFLPHERAATMVRVHGEISAAMIEYDAGTFYVQPRRV